MIEEVLYDIIDSLNYYIGIDPRDWTTEYYPDPRNNTDMVLEASNDGIPLKVFFSTSPSVMRRLVHGYIDPSIGNFVAYGEDYAVVTASHEMLKEVQGIIKAPYLAYSLAP